MPHADPQKLRAKRLIHTIGAIAVGAHCTLLFTFYSVKLALEPWSLHEVDYYSAGFGRVYFSLVVWWGWRIWDANQQNCLSPSVGHDPRLAESVPGLTAGRDVSGQQPEASSTNQGAVESNCRPLVVYTAILVGTLMSYFIRAWLALHPQTNDAGMPYYAYLHDHLAVDIIGISSFAALEVLHWVCRRLWLQAPKDDSAGVQVS